MKQIVLVNGLPRAGKDTYADYLVERYGFTKMSFANILKDIIAVTFDISIDKLNDYKNNNEPILVENEEISNFRLLLQRFGTEGMKKYFGDDIWSELLYKQIAESEFDKIVVPDFRFLSEFKPNKGIITTVLIKDNRELPLEGHKSDVELYQNNFVFDYTIDNISTLEEYYNKIDLQFS